MREVNIKLTPKQADAIKFLKDDVSEEIIFGGGAGGGKSWLGCVFVTLLSLGNDGIRTFVARQTWESCRETTLKTFFGVLTNVFGMVQGEHYTYNGQTKTLKFLKTKSEVVFGYLMVILHLQRETMTWYPEE